MLLSRVSALEMRNDLVKMCRPTRVDVKQMLY